MKASAVTYGPLMGTRHQYRVVYVNGVPVGQLELWVSYSTREPMGLFTSRNGAPVARWSGFDTASFEAWLVSVGIAAGE